MALILADLGRLDFQQRIDEARQHFEGSLKIYRQLAHQNPDMYLPSVATALRVLGCVAESKNQIEESRAHINRHRVCCRSWRRATADMRATWPESKPT
jgi:hypothetical protein